jgi:hypothetical protein
MVMLATGWARTDRTCTTRKAVTTASATSPMESFPFMPLLLSSYGDTSAAATGIALVHAGIKYPSLGGVVKLAG